MSRCVNRPVPFLAVVGAVLVTAACGSHSESVLAPSDLGSSATINGTVQIGVGASSSSRQPNASAAGIHVSIEGTGLSATTDQSGRFVISGAPSGSATLRFEGPGIDARLKLSGLVAGQVLTIEVQVAGGRAVLAGSADDSPSPSPSPSASPSPSPSPSPGDEDEEDGDNNDNEGDNDDVDDGDDGDGEHEDGDHGNGHN